jgi:perosamine synthetase
VYKELLKDLQGIQFQPSAEWATPAPWLFSILINEDEFGKSRNELIQILDEQGIETRPFFIPLHTLPPFREESLRRRDHLPRTVSLANSGINLPTYTEMSHSDIEKVVEKIKMAGR